MISLTKRQLASLRYITGYVEAHGYCPSIDEIGRSQGCARGNGGIHETLKALERAGAIRRLPNRARAIEVLHPVSIPRSPDGEPLYSVRLPALEK